MIARNRLAVAVAAIVEVGCYCGEGDRSKYYWNCDHPIFNSPSNIKVDAI
jgi:hypothetical protein